MSPVVGPPGLAFCCPVCKGPLDHRPEAYACRRCDRRYPIVLDLPDFRVFPDPYLGLEEDREKGRELACHFDRKDFRGLAELYYEITPSVPKDLARRYLRHVLTGVARGEASLAELAALGLDGNGEGGAILDIGCGTGGFLVAAGQRYATLVGADIAFRWLIIARKRAQEANRNVTFVCCCGEYLPFAGNPFDLVVASDVLEHTMAPQEVVREGARVLRPGGIFFVATPNRWTVGPEPCVRVWGVGFLPRRLMKAYVGLVRGIPYENIRTLSFFELKRLLSRAPFDRRRILLPAFPPDLLASFSRGERVLARLYNWVRRVPAIRLLLYLFGPLFHAICTKEVNDRSELS